MVAFCHLLLVVLPLHPQSGEAAPAAEPDTEKVTAEALADPAEDAAFLALYALEDALEVPPATPDETTLRTWTEQRVGIYAAFAAAHRGRLACAEAWHTIGLLRLQSEVDPGLALTAMQRAWRILRDFEGVRPAAARLSAHGYGDYLLAAQLDLEDLDAADAMLIELRERAGSMEDVDAAEAAIARHARLDLEAARLKALRRLQVGQRFPVFSVQRLDGGGPIGTAELRGAPALIEFHATWCGPAMGLPQTAGTALEQPEMGVLTILLDDTREQALTVLEAEATDPSLAWAPGGLPGDFARGFALRSLPRSFLLDAEGRIVARDLRGAALRAALHQMLPATPPAPAPVED